MYEVHLYLNVFDLLYKKIYLWIHQFSLLLLLLPFVFCCFVHIILFYIFCCDHLLPNVFVDVLCRNIESCGIDYTV